MNWDSGIIISRKVIIPYHMHVLGHIAIVCMPLHNYAQKRRPGPLKCDGSHPLKLHIMFDSHDIKLSLKLILSSLVLLEHKGTGTHNYYHYQKILVYKLMHQLLQC